MINLISQKDFNKIKQLTSSKKINKILLITGYNSFYKSGAEKIIKKILDVKKLSFFFKKKKLS